MTKGSSPLPSPSPEAQQATADWMHGAIANIDSWLKENLPEGALASSVALNQVPFLAQFVCREHWIRSSSSKTNRSKASKRAERAKLFVAQLPQYGLQNKASTNFTAILLHPGATRAFLPVASELKQQGASTHLLVSREDRASQELARTNETPFTITESLFSPRVISQGTRSYLAIKKSLLRNDILEGLYERAFSAEVRSRGSFDRLSTELDRQCRRACFQGSSILGGLQYMPAPQHLIFVTHRALLRSLFRSTHPDIPVSFFLQGIVPDVPPLRTDLDVTKALVGSHIDTKYLSRCGVPKTQQVVMGYPEYDSLAGIQRINARAWLEKKHPRLHGRRCFLFTSQYPTTLFDNEARETNLQEILRAARLSPNEEFIIKLHPRREVFSPTDRPANVTVLKDEDTIQLIAAVDAVITYWSTTALEAVLLGTPLVQLNATGLPDFFDLSTPMDRATARSAKELPGLLAEAVSAKGVGKQDSLRKKLGLHIDGDAAQRAALALMG